MLSILLIYTRRFVQWKYILGYTKKSKTTKRHTHTHVYVFNEMKWTYGFSRFGTESRSELTCDTMTIVRSVAHVFEFYKIAIKKIYTTATAATTMISKHLVAFEWWALKTARDHTALHCTARHLPSQCTVSDFLLLKQNYTMRLYLLWMPFRKQVSLFATLNRILFIILYFPHRFLFNTSSHLGEQFSNTHIDMHCIDWVKKKKNCMLGLFYLFLFLSAPFCWNSFTQHTTL